MRFLGAIGIMALALCGCASFTTKQTDTSYGTNGLPIRSVTTKATARTVFEAKSALANFKASQTDKTQSATVGALSQEASSTNAAATLDAVTRLLQTVQ